MRCTAMDDIVAVTIVESTANLMSEPAACDTFTRSTVADDVVEHLAATHVFEDHVIVMLMDDHFAHG